MMMKFHVLFFSILVMLTLLLLPLSSTIAATRYTIDNPPKVPGKYVSGMEKFRSLCSGCHGKWGNGTSQGPPLMHGFYKPSHHGDPAFYRAVLKGVQAHHWHFGDMPPVPGATQKDVDILLPFIRWLQRENGIY